MNMTLHQHDSFNVKFHQHIKYLKNTVIHLAFYINPTVKQLTCQNKEIVGKELNNLIKRVQKLGMNSSLTN